MTEEEITDKKLLRYRKKTHGVKTTAKPDIIKLRDVYHKPDSSVSIIIDGVQKKIKPELVLTKYRCNKCETEFNHTQQMVVAGILPVCPNCDR